MQFDWLSQLAVSIAVFFGLPPEHAYQVKAFAAILFVAVACGALGSLVIGNRMAFFSDAMAHTSMAGVTLAFLLLVLTGLVKNTDDADRYLWVIPLVMAAFGVAVGLTIAVVQDRTALGSDTVIGIFFAFALGFAGLLLPALQKKVNFNVEGILFGQVTVIDDFQLLVLAGLAVVTLAVVALKYNSFVFGSFNPTLARSRGIAVRGNNYLFVALLALVVNLSINAVGVLLINALLVVPAAAAVNVSGNLRRMFWFTFLGAIGCAAAGYRISATTVIPLNEKDVLEPGPSGAVVIACVLWFFASLVLRAVRRRFYGAAVPVPCLHDHGDGQYPHAH